MAANPQIIPSPDNRELMAMALAPFRAMVASAYRYPVPRANGHDVVVIPGLGTTDESLATLRGMLRRAGYRPTGWEMGVNNGFTLEDLQRLTARVRQMAEESGQSVSLIGWSLGGVYARAIAQEAPKAVAQVITLGTPWRGIEFTSIAKRHQAKTGEHISQAIPAPIWRRLQKTTNKLAVPYTSIYSRDDGIVDWEACVVELSPENRAQSIEVSEQHFGLPYSIRIFSIVEELLSSDVSPEGWTPHPLADGAADLTARTGTSFKV